MNITCAGAVREMPERATAAECLKAFSNCRSSISRFLTVFFDCDCSAYRISPASILKTNRLNFLNLLIYI